jgi:hypothetical protein
MSKVLNQKNVTQYGSLNITSNRSTSDTCLFFKESKNDIFANNRVNLHSIHYFSADKLTKLPSQHAARILNIGEKIKVFLSFFHPWKIGPLSPRHGASSGCGE